MSVDPESDDDVPRLSDEALAALAAFQAEQAACGEGKIAEDWQLSQFWYTRETADRLALEAVTALDGSSSPGPAIACISCPTLVESLNAIELVRSGAISVALFEFDTRFARKYPDQFRPYDYRSPLALPSELIARFDVIVADPPFLSDECVVKTAQTIRRLSRSTDTKVILCTGRVMKDLVHRLLAVKCCEFRPRHVNNLANAFACFANYATTFL